MNKFPMWVNFYKDVTNEIDIDKSLLDRFDIEYNNYLSIKNRLLNNDGIVKFDHSLIDSIFDKVISTNNASHTELIENNKVSLDDLNHLHIINDKTYLRNISSYMLLDAYMNLQLENEIDIDTIRYFHKYINKFNKETKPGIIRNTKTNPYNVEIKNANIVFVEYQFVRKQLKKQLDSINKLEIHPVIKSALIHGIIVGVHPFVDGNGRIARYMSDKYLEKEYSDRLYISQSINESKDKYYKTLNKLFFELDPNPFIEYIFEMHFNQFKFNIDLILNITNISNDLYMKIKLSNNIKEVYINKIIKLLLEFNSLTIQSLLNELNITRATAYSIIDKLIDNDIISKGERIGKSLMYKMK